MRKMQRRNPSLRLKTVKQLKEAGNWIEDAEQYETRKHLDAIMSLNDALEMETPLTKAQQVTAAYYKGSNTFDAADQMYEDYFKQLRYKAQHDLAAYHEYINPNEIPAMHHKFVCEKLMDLEARKIRLLLLSMPPGSAKSQYASRSFIQWYLGRNPHHKILSGGYNMAFVQNEFSKPNRSVMTSDEYQSVFPDVHIDPSFRSAGLWAIENFGGRYNVRSVGAGTSGIRADLIVLDDIIAGAKTAQSPTELQNANNWVTGDVLPRRLGNNSIILIIGTRWHSEDTIGFMERMLEENPEIMPEPAEVINISAEGGPENPLVEEGHWLWEEFYGSKHYMTQKGLMEPGVWSATYLGIPLDQQGFYLAEDEIGRYDELPDPIDAKGKYKITMSIDTAQKSTTDSNRTAIAVFAEHIPTKTHYLIDAWAGREPLLILIDRIGKMVKKNGAHSILIEDAAMGSQILENYRQAFTCPLIGFKPQLKGNKQFNLDTFLVPAIQGGKILFPKNKDWVVDVINEIVAFPQALLDDYVDACSQYARRIMKRRKLGMKEMRVGY